jgi:hypothetical protein
VYGARWVVFTGLAVSIFLVICSELAFLHYRSHT